MQTYEELGQVILPIRAYGDPILRRKAEEVPGDSPQLQQLIDDMIETMKGADGAGLAAPQVGRPLRLFVADLRPAWRALPIELRTKLPRQPMVCINPEFVYRSEEKEEFGEGCLSIPTLSENLRRPSRVVLRYLDRRFEPQEIEGASLVASVLQHEFDHLNGVLYIDHLPPGRRRAIRKRLSEIERGEVRPAYPMQFARGAASAKI